MLKVLVACGNGMGTSMIIKMKIETIFQKIGLEATIDHGTVGDATATAGAYDVVFCPYNLLNQFDSFKGTDLKVIGLQNVLSEAEITQRLRDAKVIE